MGVLPIVLAAWLSGCGDEKEDGVAWADFCPAYWEVECEGRALALPSCNWPVGPPAGDPALGCHMEAFCWETVIDNVCRDRSWHTFCGNEPARDVSPETTDACLEALAASDFTMPGDPRDRASACAAICD